jgi:IPTL-CTERM motif
MNFRKSILGLTTCIAVAGLFAWSSTSQAAPRLIKIDTDAPQFDLKGKSTINAVAGPTCESTGFEAVEGACGWEQGFICGSGFVGICTAPASGTCTGDNSTDQNCCAGNPNPLNGWFLSISSRHCNEPHIDTANPATGTQHMRFSQDVQGGDPPGCTGFTGACRISAFTPTATGVILGRTVISFDIASEHDNITPGGALGSSGQYFTVGDGGGSVLLGLDKQDVLFVYHNATQSYEGIGFLSANGNYDHVEIDMDVCNNLITYTLTDGTGAITGFTSEDFTGVNQTVDRAIITNDNAGFFWDFDNYSVVRDAACPPQCIGNGVQAFLGEDCDGADDAACPGRCRPAGDPDGECTCIRNCDLCSNEAGCVAENGTNGPFLTHGGFFTYVADGQFVGIDTCGSDFDTALFVGDADFCSTFAFTINDTCDNRVGDCSDGNHGPETCMPFASCYDNVTADESCLCIETTAGSTLSIWASQFPGAQPDAGTNLMLTITKASSCGPNSAAIPNGACCRGDAVGGLCEDNVLAADCAGPSDTFSDNKLCSMVSCAQDTGGCCDSAPGLGGQCTAGVLSQDCTGQYQAFSKLDDTCGNACAEITGACCDTLTGNCFDSIQSGCNESASHTSWAIGQSCTGITCLPDMGACCDTGTNDPTVATCTQTIAAACDCTKCGWTKGALCEDVECLPNFQVIPTVSEWGLVVLTLLLLVGGKIYFGRREASMA